jgi:hypothetical protein
MFQRILNPCAYFLLACSVAGGQIRPGEKAVPLDAYLSDPNSVAVNIAPIASSAAAIQGWMATYAKGGRLAKFRIELKRASDGTGEGAFVTEPGSDNSVLIADLKKALEAKHVPSRIRRLNRLRFTYVVFGVNQSQIEGGGFTSKPAGNWIAVKIFFPVGGDDSEVFLNLNPVSGTAQFSEKDVDYGDDLLARLSAVL